MTTATARSRAAKRDHAIGASDNVPLKRSFGDAILEIPLELLDRHPVNRHPTVGDIQQRAASLAADTQLEPIVARLLDNDRYQIISGETRCLAARSLRWPTIKARVIECDDATALQLLAKYNSERRDLNPIERAQLIEQLCKSTADHGGGLTRSDAAAAVGLESGSAGSNLVRLLELPKQWQDRVSSGELGESFARCLLKANAIPAALKQLETAWKRRNSSWEFRTRNDLDRAVNNALRESTRGLGKNDEQRYSAQQTGSEYVRYVGCLISAKVLKENADELAIVEIDGKHRATNCELFDRLNLAEYRRKKSAAAKQTANDNDRQANKQTDLKQRARQLAQHVRQWRERFMRRAVAAAVLFIKSTDTRIISLLCHFIRERGGIHHDANKQIHGCQTAPEILSMLIGGSTTSLSRPQSLSFLEDAHLEKWFVEFNLDPLHEWKILQSGPRADADFLQELYSLFRKTELQPLAIELGVHLTGNESKEQMIGRILMSPRPLPKCLGFNCSRSAKK